MNFILLFVIISVLLLDKFYFKKNNSDNIDKILLTSVDGKNNSKFKLKNRSIFIISALVVVIVLKLIFNQNLQDLSTSFFSINIDELLICILVLIFYIYFSIITVSSRVSNKKIIAREFLYLVFNLILISGLWFSQSKLEEDFQNYSIENSKFLKEIKDQKIIDSELLPTYDLNEFQSKKAKDLGYIIDDEKYLISKWYEVLKKSSNTSPYKEFYFSENQEDLIRVGYRSVHSLPSWLIKNNSVDTSSRYGINYIPSSHIDSLKLSNPKLYNDFIDFFGPLNKLDLDEFYGASNKFYYKDKPVKISVSDYSSNDLTLEYTIGKYSVNDILTENISKRRIKKYYHSYYRKSPTDTRRIIPKAGGTFNEKTAFDRGGNLEYVYTINSRNKYLPLTTDPDKIYNVEMDKKKYKGVYIWNKRSDRWTSFYEFDKAIEHRNLPYDEKYNLMEFRGFFKWEEIDNGKLPSKLNVNDLPTRLCEIYNCETYSVTTDYNISMDYTETDKEKILNFDLALNIEYLDQYNDLFSQIDGYDYSDFYFEKEIKTLGTRDIKIYNKTEDFYTYSLFKSLDDISLDLYEKYILLLKTPLDNKEIQYKIFNNSRKVFISEIQQQADNRGISFDEYKTLASATFSKGNINNKSSFFGLVFMIGFIAYLCRLIISGILWSISALK